MEHHASAANMPGPSNMDLWNALNAKDQQLVAKDQQLTAVGGSSNTNRASRAAPSVAHGVQNAPPAARAMHRATPSRRLKGEDELVITHSF